MFYSTQKSTDKEYNPFFPMMAAENIFKIYEKENNIKGQQKILKDLKAKFPKEYAEGKFKDLKDKQKK